MVDGKSIYHEKLPYLPLFIEIEAKGWAKWSVPNISASFCWACRCAPLPNLLNIAYNVPVNGCHVTLIRIT